MSEETKTEVKESKENVDPITEESTSGAESSNGEKEIAKGVKAKEEVDTRTPEEKKFEELQKRRMGNFKVSLAKEDAIYLRNLLDKSEYRGPQQAYLLLISKSEMSSLANQLENMEKGKRHEVEMTSACIESLNFFMNNKIGKGTDSANKLFAASMLLRPAIAEINKIDQELEEFRKKASNQ